MSEENLYPKSVAILPSVIIDRNTAIIEKYGLDNFTKRHEFKKAREMYQSAMYALGLTAKFGIKYWVCPASDKLETPDTFLIQIPDIENGELKVECVEIALWNEHEDDMLKIIENKIKKAYPCYFSVVIHVSREGENITADHYARIHNKLKDINLNVGCVRFWHTINNTKERDILLGELYPTDKYTEFLGSEILNIYNSITQKTIKIDIDSGIKRFKLKEDDINVKLPALSEYNFN